MNLTKQLRFSYLFIGLLCTSALLFSCGSDDDMTEMEEMEEPGPCSEFTTLDGSMEIDGETFDLLTAQMLIQSSGSLNSYLCQITALRSDCLESRSIGFSIEVPSANGLNGTFAFKDFFDANVGDATGSYTVQKLDDLSQSIREIDSGTLQAQDHGGNSYTLDIDANLAGGDNVKMNITHTF